MMLAARRDLNRTLRTMRLRDEGQRETIDGLPDGSPSNTWTYRVANEVRSSIELILVIRAST
jgi:hypothetical protein